MNDIPYRRHIDALVYELYLYGLTEVEIRIVEGAQSNKKTDLEAR